MSEPAVLSLPQYVLIADADRHIAELVTTFLSDAVETVWFADARAAFDAARTHPPLLIIAEILLPRLDGLTFCRLVKDDLALQHTKFLVLSVLSARKRAAASGADAFVMKPLERQGFIATFNTLVSNAAMERAR